MRRKTALVGYSYLAGVFFASFLSVSNIFFASAFMMIILLAFVVLYNNNPKKYLACIVSVISMTVGLCVYGIYEQFDYNKIIKLDNQSANFTGKIVEYSYTSGDQMKVVAKGKINNQITKIIVYMPYTDCDYCDKISFKANFKKIENNISFNSKDYYKPNGIYLNAYNPSEISISDGGFSVIRPIKNFSEKVYNTILTSIPSDEGALLGAMLCGKKDDIDSLSSTALFKVGIGHIFSVSGTHLVIISFIFSYIFDFLKLSKTKKIFLTEIVIVLFAIFAGMSSSIVRSAIMMTIFNFSKIARRHPDSLTTIAICGILLTIFSPEKIRSVSFLLSMSGAFAMSVVYPAVAQEIKYNGKFKSILQNFLACLIVWLVSVPIVLMYFDEISTLSALFNIVFLPLCTASLVLTVIATLPMVFGFTITPLLSVAGLLVGLVTKIARIFSKSWIAILPLNFKSVKIAIALGVVVSLVVLIVKRNGIATLKACFVCIVAVIVTFTATTYATRQQVDVYVLNYKNSYAVVLKKNTKAVIIDNDGKISNAVIRLVEHLGVREVSTVLTNENNESARAFYYNNLEFIEYNLDNCYKLDQIEMARLSDATLFGSQEYLTVEYKNMKLDIPFEFENTDENGQIYKYTIYEDSYTKGEFCYAFG